MNRTYTFRFAIAGSAPVAAVIVFLLLCVNGYAGAKNCLSGVITDNHGAALDKVQVRLVHRQSSQTIEAVTDSAGKWIVTGLTGGDWELRFSKDGYRNRKITVLVRHKDCTKIIRVNLEYGLQLSSEDRSKIESRELIEKGNAMRKEGEFEAALQSYQKALKIDPELWSIYADIGNIYFFEMQKFDAAVDAYSKLLLRDPKNHESRIALLTIHLYRKEIKKATEVASGLNLERIKNAEFLLSLGLAFYEGGETEESIRYLESATVLNPDLADAFFLLGLAFQKQNRQTEAKEAFCKTIELDPLTERAHHAEEMIHQMN